MYEGEVIYDIVRRRAYILNFGKQFTGWEFVKKLQKRSIKVCFKPVYFLLKLMIKYEQIKEFI